MQSLDCFGVGGGDSELSEESLDSNRSGRALPVLALSPSPSLSQVSSELQFEENVIFFLIIFLKEV